MTSSGANIRSDPPGKLQPLERKDDDRKIVGKTSLNRAIFRIALPATAGYYMEFFYNIVDTFWVGKLGASALAAVGISTFSLWAVFTLTDVFASGTTAVVARRVGEEKYEEATHFAGSVLPGVVAGGFIIMILGLLNIDNLFAFIDPSPEAAVLGKNYLSIVLSGSVFVFLAVWCEFLFQANGDAKTPMKILGVSLGLNAVLTPLLVFGIGFFPELGIRGAAIGTFLSMGMGSSISLVVLVRRGLLPQNISGYKPSLGNILKVMRIGIPSSITGFTFCVVLVVITKIASQYGDEVLAAITVGVRLEDFVWVLCVGLYMSALTIVGQMLGSGDKAGAVKAGWRTMLMGAGTAAVFSVIFFFAGKWLVYPFNTDPVVLQYGEMFLKIDCFGLPFMVVGVILSGAMVGAGAAIIPMLVTVPLILLRIPAAILLSENAGLGVKGIFIALAATMVVRGSAMVFVYSRKKWLGTVV